MPGHCENLRFPDSERHPGEKGVRSVVVILICLGLNSGCVFETRHQDPGILFMGNSITLNLPVPDRGWSGSWGMAASSQAQDYAHQTVRLLKEKGLPLEMAIADRNCPDCDGAIDEQAHNMDQVKRLHPRYVVVQLSEHSFDIELRSGKMTEQYRSLLQGLQNAGVPHVYCMGAWGEKDSQGPHAVAIWLALKNFPSYSFVDISKPASDTLNYGDTTRYSDKAVAWHPGDRGMLVLAQTLSDAIWADR